MTEPPKLSLPQGKQQPGGPPWGSPLGAFKEGFIFPTAKPNPSLVPGVDATLFGTEEPPSEQGGWPGTPALTRALVTQACVRGCVSLRGEFFFYLFIF